MLAVGLTGSMLCITAQDIAQSQNEVIGQIAVDREAVQTIIVGLTMLVIECCYCQHSLVFKLQGQGLRLILLSSWE